MLSRIPSADAALAFADRDAAWTWFHAELANLQAAVVSADTHLPGPEPWVLASQLVLFFAQGSRWAEAAATFTVALRSARRDGDPLANARILSLLAYALGHLQRHEEALDAARLGVEAAEQIGDLKLLVIAYNSYGCVLLKAGQPRAAVTNQQKMVDVLRQIDMPERTAAGLADLAEALAACGEHGEAAACLEEALPLARKASRPFIEAYVLNAMGVAHLSNGSASEAVSLLTDAARLRASIDDRAGQAESLLRLSRALANLGRAPGASAIWNEASAMVDEIGSTRLVELRATLEADAAVTAELAEAD